MKKFEFSLGRILDFKNQLLEREKNELLRLRQEKTRLEELMRAQEEDFEVVSAAMDAKSRAGTTILILQGYQNQLDGIRMTQEQLSLSIAEAQEKVDRQLEQVLKMSQEVSGLDKLKDHQREEYQEAATKAAQANIEEFVSGQFARQLEA